ncbi:hypothetical protein L486_08115 [Kwoniella mangroviensis CBS 10435]|uniref:Uncharacterized protein n=1 Tax=Kwoniella mangroviensis CBS 10435 TaxID=1331196 RepID=A0A1B9IGP0_9TREE|nr:hypothetical protein L486_08115 [Kwoniella mangroviensis CBS 10435]
MYTERKVDRQNRDEWDGTEGDVNFRFSSPIYAEEPSLISTIAVKREREPIPPATARTPRPHKFHRDHWSPPSDFKTVTHPPYLHSTQHSSDHIARPTNLDVKVEVDVQDGQTQSMNESLTANSRSIFPGTGPLSQSIPHHPARDNVCSPRRIMNIGNDSNSHSTAPHPQQYHFRPPARSTTFSSRSPPLRNSSNSSRRKRDIAVPHGRRVKTSHDPRTQQNRNTNISIKENAETLEDFLSSSKRVLNPEEVYASPTSQLRNEFFSQSIHESLYVTKWKDALDSVDKLGNGGDSLGEAIKIKGLLEIGIQLLKISISGLSTVADRRQLLGNHRILIIGSWKQTSIVGELKDQLGKLGGTVCTSEDELFYKGARTYIQIIGPGFSGSSYISTANRRIERMERWTIQSCLVKLIKWCDAKALRNKPLDARLEILGSQCKKNCWDIGAGKEVSISGSIPDESKVSIRRICDYERFLIHPTVRYLTTSNARDRIVITPSSSTTVTPDRHDLMRMTMEGFYDFVIDLREYARRASRESHQPRMSADKKRFAKTLPPTLATDAICT